MNFLSILITIFIIGSIEAKYLPKNTVCQDILGDDLIKEIASYECVRDEILEYVLEGDFKGKTYDEWVLLKVSKFNVVFFEVDFINILYKHTQSYWAPKCEKLFLKVSAYI